MRPFSARAGALTTRNAESNRGDGFNFERIPYKNQFKIDKNLKVLLKTINLPKHYENSRVPNEALGHIKQIERLNKVEGVE
jgi:hypothetical protein